MNRFLDDGATSGPDVFPLKSNRNLNKGDDGAYFRNVRWTYPGYRERFQRPSLSQERIFCIPRNNLDGTNPNRVPTPMIQKAKPQSEIDMLKNSYVFREPDQVKSFLSGNTTLRKMLSAMYSKIRKEFLSEKIILEVFSDSPESSEKDVVVSVTTSLPVDEAIERLDKVEDVRWIKDSSDPYVNICVKLEYQ